MWARLGAWPPAAGASRRVRISFSIIAGARQGGTSSIGPMGTHAHGPLGPSSFAGRPTVLTPARPPRKMGTRVRRRRLAAAFALVALAAPAGSAAATAPSPQLQQKLARALRVPHVSPARSGAQAVDLSTGTVIYAQNGSLPLAPASNEKLPLTYAALSVLGPSYRFETDVLGEGSQV